MLLSWRVLISGVPKFLVRFSLRRSRSAFPSFCATFNASLHGKL